MKAKRRKFIGIKLTASEYADVRRLIKYAGVTVSELFRRLLAGALQEERVRRGR